MSQIIAIADAVAAELNGGSFSQSFTATRRILPEYTLADLEALQVAVVPHGVEYNLAGRSIQQADYQIDIGIQKKLAGSGAEEIPALLALVEEIGAYLLQRPLVQYPGALWLKTANEPIYAPEHLVEKRVFTSVLTLTYRQLV